LVHNDGEKDEKELLTSVQEIEEELRQRFLKGANRNIAQRNLSRISVGFLAPDTFRISCSFPAGKSLIVINKLLEEFVKILGEDFEASYAVNSKKKGDVTFTNKEKTTSIRLDTKSNKIHVFKDDGFSRGDVESIHKAMLLLEGKKKRVNMGGQHQQPPAGSFMQNQPRGERKKIEEGEEAVSVLESLGF